MSVFSPENKVQGYRETNRILKFAIGLDPADVALSTSRSYFHSIVGDQADMVVRAFVDSGQPKPLEGTEVLLRNNIGDARTVMRRIVDVHPADMSLEQLISIGAHPRSVQAVAELAAHSVEQSSLFVANDNEDFYRLSADGEYVETLGEAGEPNLISHCPAVITKKGEFRPIPVFIAFAPWATELAARSLVLSRARESSRASFEIDEALEQIA